MIKLYKQIGETPLEALRRLRRQRPELSESRLSYAGRLDPMAAGILPVLVGEENDNRESFLSTDKTYRFEVLFGVDTDTFDLLGLPTCSANPCEFAGTDAERQAGNFKCIVNDTEVSVTQQKIKNICDQLTGKQAMKYPPFSAKTVSLDDEMMPLWKIVRSGRLDEIDMPTKEVEIYDLTFQEIERAKKNYIINYIINQIEKVDGDFRQEEISAKWEEVFADLDDNAEFPLATFRLHCSTGTYVRRLVNDVGVQIGVPATSFSITRIGVSANS